MSVVNTTATGSAITKYHGVDSWNDTSADTMRVVHLEEKQLTVMDSGCVTR